MRNCSGHVSRQILGLSCLDCGIDRPMRATSTFQLWRASSSGFLAIMLALYCVVTSISISGDGFAIRIRTPLWAKEFNNSLVNTVWRNWSDSRLTWTVICWIGAFFVAFLYILRDNTSHRGSQWRACDNRRPNVHRVGLRKGGVRFQEG